MDLQRRHRLAIKAGKEGIEFQLERQVRASRSVCRRRHWNHPTLGALSLAPTWIGVTLDARATRTIPVSSHTRVLDA